MLVYQRVQANNIGMDPSEQISEPWFFYQPTYEKSKKRAEQISEKSSCLVKS